MSLTTSFMQAWKMIRIIGSNAVYLKKKPTNSSIYPVNRKDIYTCDFGFRVHKKYNENGVGYIGLVYFEGSSVKDVLKITSYNKFQSLLLNLYYNKTPVILDIEDESNIDTSLGLDI